MAEARKHVAGAVLVSLLAAGCPGDPPGDDQPFVPTIEQPWRPATVPYDPSCKVDCKEIDRRTLDHLGVELVLRANPAVDDPVAQWGDCVLGAVACVERGETLLSCARKAPCPAPCVDAFASRPAADEAERRMRFVEVFLQEGAVCRPREEVRP